MPAVFRGRNSPSHMLNNFEAVNNASDKIKFLQIMDDNDLPIPGFCLGRNEDMDTTQLYYARTLTRSHGGNGIVVGYPSELPNAPLYTEAITLEENDAEYRVHIFKDKVLAIQKKMKMSSEKREEYGIEEVNMLVRNLKGGWIFSRFNGEENWTLPDTILDDCKKAINVLGLDFGAIDLIVKEDSHYFLEVNTAPGLEGSTINDYTNAIIEWYNG